MRRSDLLLRLVALGVAPALAFGQFFPGALAATPGESVTLRGAIAWAEDAGPVPNARVHVIHLDTKQVFASAPSAPDGAYTLAGLPDGYYDLVVETLDGLYLANRVINAAPGEDLSISLMLGPPLPEDTEWWAPEPERRIPGLDRIPDGVARIVVGEPRPLPLAAAPGAEEEAAAIMAAEPTKRRWLVPVLIGGGVVGLALLISDDDDKQPEVPISPFSPTP